MVIISAEYLREDVQDFLNMNLEELCFYNCSLPMREFEIHYRRLQKGVSKLCGWDAPPERQNQQLYECALDTISEILFSGS